MNNIYPIFKYLLIRDIRELIERKLKGLPKIERTYYQNMFMKANIKKRSKIIQKLLEEFGCLFEENSRKGK
jgi:hypothetical protein